MQKGNPKPSIQDLILELENQQAEAKADLQGEIENIYESVRPINIIKKTLSELSISDEVKNDLVISSIGLVVGYFIRKVKQTQPNNLFKNILLPTAMLGITNLMMNKPKVIKSLGLFVLDFFKKKLNH